METISLAYPAKLTPDDGGFIVTFRDVPEALTQGDDEAEALAQAADALSVALAGYVKAGRDLPAPTEAKRGETIVHADPTLAAKVALRRMMFDMAINTSQLARRLDVDVKEARRLLDPDHPSKLNGLDQALRALGHRAVLHVMPLQRDLPVRNAKPAPKKKVG